MDSRVLHDREEVDWGLGVEDERAGFDERREQGQQQEHEQQQEQEQEQEQGQEQEQEQEQEQRQNDGLKIVEDSLKNQEDEG